MRTVSPATLEVPITTPGVAEEWEIQFQPYLKDQPVGIASDFAPPCWGLACRGEVQLRAPSPALRRTRWGP